MTLQEDFRTERRPSLPVYTSRAGRYDQDTEIHDRWRRCVVDALPLRPGHTVLDVGCVSFGCGYVAVGRVPSGTATA